MEGTVYSSPLVHGTPFYSWICPVCKPQVDISKKEASINVGIFIKISETALSSYYVALYILGMK
jgi:hypothetical protein